jgi:hypothetical protein
LLSHSRSIAGIDPRAALRRTGYLVPLLWFGAVVGGLAALQEYKSRPGTSGHTPILLREPSAFADSDGRPRLMMFLHPKCPCSKASLNELAEIIGREPGKVALEIIFVKPKGAGAGWAQTSLREQAAAIPDARLIEDDGTLAHRFGAETSGYAVLYDAAGYLLFSGGITQSRGHEGESAGRHAIVALLNGEPDAVSAAKTPVFGCPLFAPGECVDRRPSVDGTGTSP